jgi:hypothetical protein
MSDAQRIAKIVAGMAELLGVQASRERILGYVAALADLPAERVAIGIERAVQDWRFPDMPKPGDIRAAVSASGRLVRHATQWPNGWRDRCPHGTCLSPSQCPEAWVWVKAIVLSDEAPASLVEDVGASVCGS